MIVLRALTAAVVLSLGSTALAATPPATPTAEEQKKIAKGEVVTRSAPDLDPPGAYAWVQISADSAAVWNVLNDPSEAAAASGAVESCDTYINEPTEHGRKIGLHYVLNVAWTEVSYYVIRDFRPSEGWMTWTLDPEKKSDLVFTAGRYEVVPGATPDTVVLSYATQTDSGRNVPTWITQMLTGKALKGYLGHVKTVAER